MNIGPSSSRASGDMHVYTRVFTMRYFNTRISWLPTRTGCIASVSTHDSAHKEQICSLHLGTIDHSPRRTSRCFKSRFTADNDAGALASAVNLLLVHGALHRAGNVRVSVLLLINYVACRPLRSNVYNNAEPASFAFRTRLQEFLP